MMWLKHYLICLLCLTSPAIAGDGKAAESISGIIGSVAIDNGTFGDGRWQVLVGQGGDVLTANLDPVGAEALVDVIRNIYTYIDVGANGGAFPLNDPPASPTAPAAGPNNSVVSSGQFAGGNATIAWSSSAVVAMGADTYRVVLTFNSAQPFGNVRVIHYVDADLFNSGDDKLVIASPLISPELGLLTIDSKRSVAITHVASQQSAVNASYVGFAVSDYPVLRDTILGSGVPFSTVGVNLTPVALPPTTDVRFPFSAVFGPADPTTAIALDLNPAATNAQIVYIVKGKPNVQNDAVFRDGFQ